MDARVNTANDPSTSSIDFVDFVLVIPEFRRRVCARRATRWALPRISRFLVVRRRTCNLYSTSNANRMFSVASASYPTNILLKIR